MTGTSTMSATNFTGGETTGPPPSTLSFVGGGSGGGGGLAQGLSILQAGMGVASAVNIFNEGKAIDAQSRLNAQILASNVEIAKAQGKVSRRQGEIIIAGRKISAAEERRAMNRLMSTQAALYAKSGVAIEGSPLYVLEETARASELDIMIGNINASLMRESKLSEANAIESAAKLKAIAHRTTSGTGAFRAGTKLLTTGINYAKDQLKLNESS